MISGYWSPLYATMLKGWRSIKFPAMTRGGVREEWVWMNFHPADDVSRPAILRRGVSGA